MSLLINIENYESFYLDYLEGNLNEEETKALLLFLDKHPKLKLEENLLDFSFKAEPKLDENFIESLKVFDETEIIRYENYQNFMIASLENELGVTKEDELQDFISKHQFYTQEFNLYQQTKLIPNTRIIYPEKQSLKQGIIIPLYVKVIAVASVLVLLLLTIPRTSDKIDSSKTVSYLSSNKIGKKMNPSMIELKISKKQKDPISIEKVQKNKESDTILQQNDPLIEKDKVISVNKMNLKKIDLFKMEELKKETLPLDFSYVLSDLQKKDQDLIIDQENNSHYLALKEMKNPILSFTDKLSKKLNIKIDFRTAKASDKKQGGFYLKIGKFEIIRKSPPKDALAVY